MEFRVIAIGEKAYPLLLSQIFDPPKKLYLYGASLPADATYISVVGTRRATSYGEQMTRSIVRDLALQNCVIVSGFAGGIDRFAHEAAIETGSFTVAVLAFGFDHLAGHHNRDLIPKILQNGCFISEYEPKTPGLKHHFPQRNRIIAGLSQATLVAEAPCHSGALITADYAVRYHRDLFAVPGDVIREQSLGTFQLIQEKKANPVKDANDIFQHLKIPPRLLPEQNLGRRNLSLHQQKIIAALSKLSLGTSRLNLEVETDQLLQESGLTAPELSRELSLLELDGIIVNSGGLYRLTRLGTPRRGS